MTDFDRFLLVLSIIGIVAVIVGFVIMTREARTNERELRAMERLLHQLESKNKGDDDDFYVHGG